MALAPDKINVKRRRDDDVVDILTLAGSKKQRTSDYYFIRLGSKPNLPSTSPALKPSSVSVATGQPSLPSPPGVPLIKTTLPGDEINDFKKYKAAQDLRHGPSHPTPLTEQKRPPKPPPNARRFHLTRDLSLTLRPQHSAGIRKPKSSLRPHLPTFIERLQKLDDEDLIAYAEPPVDRVIKSVDGVNHKLDLQRILSDDGSVTKEKTATFQKANSSLPKTGQSIRDDPATWDLTSDRLADELMSLALDMDPNAKAMYQDDVASHQHLQPQSIQSDTMLLDSPDNYIYETYIRVERKGIDDLESLSRSFNLGYLIVDEEEEDLWEQYLHEDDDEDDWDEEDGDSNAEDNPRNDYPEDEVSSDDEYGRNIYQYRRDHSDDEEFDQEYI